ncbi:hypothetical protein D3C86_2103710 [compost metagenome]
MGVLGTGDQQRVRRGDGGVQRADRRRQLHLQIGVEERQIAHASKHRELDLWRRQPHRRTQERGIDGCGPQAARQAQDFHGVHV